MADDLKYGYKGAEPTQSFGNNTGVFDPADINNLIADNKWPSFGQLELIETQTANSGSADIYTVNFESIQESKYNVHFLTFSEGQSNGYQFLSLRFGNGGTYTTSGYQCARQSMLNATFAFGLGSAVYTVAETINAFRIQTVVANIIETADVSLYGIRYS